MNKTQAIYLPAQELSAGTQNAVLREGSSVFVRVISQQQANTYIASFAGSRFLLNSHIPLHAGQTFRATISFKNGVVQLSPINTSSIFSKEFVHSFSSSVLPDGKLLDANLSAYFSSLGLSPDFITLALFNQMQSLSLPFNQNVFLKAYRLAQKFVGKEKEVAEVAMLLVQKGIELTEDAIISILESNSNSRGKNKNHEEENQNDDKSFSSNSSKNSSSKKINDDLSLRDDLIQSEDKIKYENFFQDVKKFFTSLFSIQQKNRIGALTLFNHTGFSDAGTWIELPFTLEDFGSGFFRYFIDLKNLGNKNDKNIDNHLRRKIALQFTFNNSTYYFTLNFTTSSCMAKYAIMPMREYSAKEKFMLSKSLNDVLSLDVVLERAEFSELSPFFSGDNNVKIVRGNA
ncbi:MAG: hypothetical protein IJR49_00570 [Treponema sp.]|nr:hypothetical protein [Treponema sp.]